LPSHQGAPLTPASQRPGALIPLERAQPGSAIAVRPCRHSTLRAAPDQAVRPPFPPVINRRAESDQARRVETRSGSMRSTPSASPARTVEPGRRSNAGASQTRHLRRRSNDYHYRPAQAQARKQHRPVKRPPARQGGARRAPPGVAFSLLFSLCRHRRRDKRDGRAARSSDYDFDYAVFPWWSSPAQPANLSLCRRTAAGQARRARGS